MGEEPGGTLESPRGVPRDVPGDAACWLASVCPACGAFNEGPVACWNCGRQPADPDGPVVGRPGA